MKTLVPGLAPGFRAGGAIAGMLLAAASATSGMEYVIVDLGVVDPGDFGSQAFRVSSGGVAVGRSLGVSNQAFSWSSDGGFVALPNLASRPFGAANGANDSGLVVGTGATTAFGSGPLPLAWQDGVVAPLPLPAGEMLGRANDVNGAGTAVGSVDGGSAEQAVIYAGGGATKITTTAPDGSFMTTAYGISDTGLVVGNGIDPGNAARNVGLVYDIKAGTMVEVGALPGRNGALAFDVSNAGHVVGSSMLNQGSGLPYIWTEKGGMTAIPLPVGTTQGSARGVNSAGMAVGTASSAFAIPFLFDGKATHRIADLLPAGSGWDLATNTSSSALGISESGIIVGTGIHDGLTRAYALIPVVACPADLDGGGDVGFGDLVALLAAWGPCVGCDADLDDSGDVGFSDLVALLAAWGPCP